MNRQTFFDRIIPGLKELRTASDLKQGFGENPPAHVSDEIRQLTRLGILKISAFSVILSFTGLATKILNNREAKELEEIYLMAEKIIGSTLNEFSPKDAPTKNLKDDGTLEALVNDLKKEPERGRIVGVPFAQLTITLPENNEKITINIDRNNSTAQALNGDKSLGNPFSLAESVFINENYIGKNNIDQFNITIPISFIYKGKTYNRILDVTAPVKIYSEETEKEIEAELRGRLQLIDPGSQEALSPENLQNLQIIIDKNSQVIYTANIRDVDNLEEGFSTMTHKDFFLSEILMGEEVLFLGEARLSESESAKYKFQINPLIDMRFFDEKGELIKDAAFEKSILISKEHLEKLGVHRIVLYVNVMVKFPGESSIRKFKFEYTINDTAKLQKEIPLKFPDSDKVTLKP